MDEDSNSENPNIGEKQDKLIAKNSIKRPRDEEGNDTNSSTSSANDKNEAKEPVPMDLVTEPIEENVNEVENIAEPGASISNKDEDSPISKSKSEITENENNEPGTSTSNQELQKNDHNNEEKKSNDGSSSSYIGNRKSGPKRRNYRARVISSSSDDSDNLNNDDENDNARAASSTTAVNAATLDRIRRAREMEITISSSSDSESNSQSEGGGAFGLGGGSDDSDSTSMGNIESMMDYEDSNSNSSSSNREIESDVSQKVKEILQRKKPEYNWCSVREIMYRENGLSGRGFHSMSGRNPISFQHRFYSARHTVEKMKLLHKLQRHQGCVNSLNFNRSGTLLVSGSDDLKIILWNWAYNKISYLFKSGHTSNVFQTKLVDLSGSVNIVSSGRDGQVRHATIRPSGGKVMSSALLKHDGAVHKLTTTPNPYEILTAGEDGHVVQFDLREPPVQHLVTVKMDKRKLPLYSIAHHPLDQEFCVCGRNQFVHVYDRRNMKKASKLLYPKHLEDKKAYVSHITCAVYNSTGSEILALYSDNDDIYLFNNKTYIPGSFIHRYRGHNNRKTIKGVNFFGLNSEYIVSGSDCGNFFFWDKETESIINWIHGDRGVVNCIEPHPEFPVLATSGLEHDVKIWMPLRDQYPPEMKGLEKCIAYNTKQFINRGVIDERRLYFLVHECLRKRRLAQLDENCPYVQDLVSSSSSDDEDMSDSDENKLRTLPCSAQ